MEPLHPGLYVMGCLCLPASYQLWNFHVQISNVGDNWVTWKHDFVLTVFILKNASELQCLFFFNQLGYGISPDYFFETSWNYSKGKLKV